MITCKICSAEYLDHEDCPNEINHIVDENCLDIDYSKMKKDELIAIAKEKGIELTGKESKADLINLI